MIIRRLPMIAIARPSAASYAAHSDSGGVGRASERLLFSRTKAAEHSTLPDGVVLEPGGASNAAALLDSLVGIIRKEEIHGTLSTKASPEVITLHRSSCSGGCVRGSWWWAPLHDRRRQRRPRL